MKNYNADDIRALSLSEQIQLRPKLYFGKCFQEGNLNVFLFEFLCHAFDEYFDHRCSQIEIALREPVFEISYNSGMSLAVPANTNISKAECIMTQIGACSNQKKHLRVGEAYCELGIAALNCASLCCELETSSNGQTGSFRFAHGITAYANITPSENKQEFTRFKVHPDYALFESLNFDVKGIEDKLAELRDQMPGLAILFKHPG